MAKLIDHGVSLAQTRAALDGLDLDVQPFDAAAGHAAGALRNETRDPGLSLGDRACLALAIRLGAVTVTADRAWTKLPREMVQVEAIR